MKYNIITKEEIIKNTKLLAQVYEFNDINMRNVAKVNKVSIGTIYNYFDSKDDIIKELIKSMWEDIFSIDIEYSQEYTFKKYFESVLDNIDNTKKAFPKFIQYHSTAFSKTKIDEVKNLKYDFIERVKNDISEILKSDLAINKEIFDEKLTLDVLTNFVFDIIYMYLYKNDTKKDFIIAIEKLLY